MAGAVSLEELPILVLDEANYQALHASCRAHSALDLRSRSSENVDMLGAQHSTSVTSLVEGLVLEAADDQDVNNIADQTVNSLEILNQPVSSTQVIAEQDANNLAILDQPVISFQSVASDSEHDYRAYLPCAAACDGHQARPNEGYEHVLATIQDHTYEVDRVSQQRISVQRDHCYGGGAGGRPRAGRTQQQDHNYDIS